MTKTMTKIMHKHVVALLVALALSLTLVGFAQDEMGTITLEAITDDGVPENISEDVWLEATGEVSVTEMDEDSYTVMLEATGLVPDGLYTFWWVNPQLIGMDMGPAGGTPENEFSADEDGNATVTIAVPIDSNYEMIAVAYHADGQTYGEEPGAMGEVTFTHLMGAFPQPMGE